MGAQFIFLQREQERPGHPQGNALSLHSVILLKRAARP